MRAFEFTMKRSQGANSLCELNRLKHQAKRRQRLDDERAGLISVMYRDHQHDRNELETERLRIELDQLKAELAQTKAETRKLDREAGLKSQTRITKMARSAMRRRKLNSAKQ